VVFIDTSIPMYLVGAAHPNKVDAQRRLETLVTQRVRLVTDAELLGVVDEVVTIDREIVEHAKHLVLQYPALPVRAALHVATMQRQGIENVLSFDPAFDRVPGLTRLR
jgi:uncharacterized protein